MKDEVQKVKYDLIERDDEISRLQLEVNSVKIKVQNQMQQQYTEQVY